MLAQILGKHQNNLKKIFNNSLIYAFEPHPESYVTLSEAFSEYKDVHTFALALGKQNGQSDFYINTYSETSSLLENDEHSKEIWGEGAMNFAKIVKVKLSTLDLFLEENSIKAIDILKMNTQGTEYQILEGAFDTLKQNKVKMIYTEIIRLPTYKGQKNFYEIVKLLADSSFNLYGIYNHRYISQELASIDAIFLHRDFKKMI